MGDFSSYTTVAEELGCTELCFSFESVLDGLSVGFLLHVFGSTHESGLFGVGSGLTGTLGTTTTGTLGFGNISSRLFLHSSQATNFVHGL